MDNLGCDVVWCGIGEENEQKCNGIFCFVVEGELERFSSIISRDLSRELIRNLYGVLQRPFTQNLNPLKFTIKIQYCTKNSKIADTKSQVASKAGEARLKVM